MDIGYWIINYENKRRMSEIGKWIMDMENGLQKMNPNIQKWSNMIQKGSKWSEMVLDCNKWTNLIQILKKSNFPKLSQMV